jgi:hypothetical protein
MRFSRDDLRYTALMALDEIADRDEPVEKALWLRFLLAWLFHESGADSANKWMFDDFWKTATTSAGSDYLDPYCRRRDLQSCMNGICRVLGWERTVPFMHEMEAQRAKISRCRGTRP